jgi:hypothetical protein
MKRFLLLLLLAFAMWELQAQIPYFASTAGDGKLYGYTSLKLRPGIWQFLKDVKHCDYFTYWDKRDNGPFWAIMRRMFKRALKKIFN